MKNLWGQECERAILIFRNKLRKVGLVSFIYHNIDVSDESYLDLSVKGGDRAMVNVFAQIVAKYPSSILVTLGGIGWLAGINGSGVILFSGIFLHVIWLFR